MEGGQNQPVECRDRRRAQFFCAPTGLPLEYLQLEQHTVEVLRKGAVDSVADLARSIGSVRLEKSIEAEARDALARLLGCCSGSSIDWFAYWETTGFAFNHLFVDCLELSEVTGLNPVCTLNREAFGNAGAMFARAGFETFGELMDALRAGVSENPPGLGRKKRDDFFARLVSIVAQVRAGEPILQELATRYPAAPTGPRTGSGTDDVIDDAKGSVLSAGVASLGLGILHLGSKTRLLEEAGVASVGDLLKKPRDELLSLRGLGKSTLKQIDLALKALVEAQSCSGDVDWDSYCDELRMKLLPTNRELSSTVQALTELPTVVRELAENVFNEDEKIILEKRIMQPPQSRLTLEAIGDLFTVKVTRERVRQKEAKILAQLASALIFDDYSNAAFHFRPAFSGPWKAAASHFSDAEAELDLADLIAGLERVWGVSRTDFVEVLPLIIAIITGELAATGGYEDAILFDPNAPGIKRINGLPLASLQLWKGASQLEEIGIKTVGDFIAALSQKSLTPSCSSAARAAFEHVQYLTESLDDTGHIDWGRYAKMAGYPVSPSIDPETPLEFLTTILPTSVEVLRNRELSAMAVDIFTRRTAVSVSQRPSSDALASEWGNHGPSVKRIETALLNFLNEVFVQGHLSVARTQLRPSFLNFWKEIDACFQQADGQVADFINALAEKWNIESAEVTQHMPAVVAIMTGYPYGRLGRYTRIARKVPEPVRVIPDKIETVSPELPSKVLLRGFKRVH